MNYPKPEILDTELKECPVYLYVPQYAFEFILPASLSDTWGGFETFSAVEGFSNFDGSMTMGDDDDAGDMEQFITSRRAFPQQNNREELCELLITSTSTKEEKVILFNSYETRTAPNKGNPNTIEVHTLNSDNMYHNELAMSEHRPFQVGSMSIEILKKPAACTAQEIYAKLGLKIFSKDANGTPSDMRIRTQYDPHSFVDTFVQHDTSFMISGYGGIELNILPGVELKITLIPAMTSGAMAAMRMRRAERKAARVEARMARANAKADRRNSRL